FYDILCRVLNSRVDVAELGEGEQVLCVLSAVEYIGGRLVDRGSPSVRGRVGLGTRVDLLCFELPLLLVRHGVLLRLWRGRLSPCIETKKRAATAQRDAKHDVTCGT